eukprot:gene2816-5538_t
MGRKSKQFIAKGEGQKYVVVHRSQTDNAYVNEEQPSAFVLVKAGEVSVNHKKSDTNIASSDIIGDHITPLGFKNDGYDYSQHLKVMGGGRFIGKDGKVCDMPYQDSINIPSDALPSDIQMERDLGAITISHEFMDKDIEAALFGGDDEEFEELADDFIIEALKEPELPNFDFDAHIANLIAKSEKKTGTCSARGAVGEDSGGVEEGIIDIDGLNESFNQEQADHSLADGVLVRKGARAIPEEDEEYDINVESSLSTARTGEVSNVKKSEQQRILDAEKVVEEKEREQGGGLEGEGGAVVVDLMHCQEYLRETRLELEWDCETILSTYSTLDNHPTLIQIPKNRRKNNNTVNSSNNSVVSSNQSHRGNIIPSVPQKIVLTGKYQLPKGFTQKSLHIPAQNEQTATSTSTSKTTTNVLQERKSTTSNNKTDENDSDEDGEADNDNDDSEDDEEVSSAQKLAVTGTGTGMTMTLSRKGETPEQRKARKAAVKEEKRMRRVTKKEVRQVFRNESSKLVQSASTGGDVDLHTQINNRIHFKLIFGLEKIIEIYIQVLGSAIFPPSSCTCGGGIIEEEAEHEFYWIRDFKFSFNWSTVTENLKQRRVDDIKVLAMHQQRAENEILMNQTQQVNCVLKGAPL